MPPPLGVPLDVSFLEDGEVDVRHDGALVAEARPIDEVDAHPPVRPTLAEAREASRRHPGHGSASLFSDCYVCGSQRHDGLGIHFGPLRGHPGVTASVFLPDATVPNRDGFVAPDMVWAALDCPSYTPPLWDWERPSLLARLAVERLDCVEVGEPTIALGWHIASEGPQAPHRVRAARARMAASSRAGARCGSRWRALHVDVARAERLLLAGVLVERVAPHAAGVVGQQVQRHRRLGRGRAHAVDVVARRQQRVEVAGLAARAPRCASSAPASSRA